MKSCMKKPVGHRCHEPRALVDKCDGSRTEHSQCERQEESHEEDHERVEPAELVLAKREEGAPGGAHVDGDGGEEAPDEHLVPDL